MPDSPVRGRPPLSEERRREQRLAVSREAVRLFREHGVGAVSGEQIARAAAISERTLWRMFRTKESCVEPLLAAVVDAGSRALREWPDGVFLDDYVREAGDRLPADDLEAALAVIRMSHDSPAVRAVWLLLQERNERVLGEVVAERAGLAPDEPEVLVQAAVVNAALRLLVDAAAYDDPGGGRERRLLRALRRVSLAVPGEGPR